MLRILQHTDLLSHVPNYYRFVHNFLRQVCILVMSSQFQKNMLCLKDVGMLLDNDYLDVEAGHGLTADNMAQAASSTYMPGVTSAMLDWWFGYIHTTEQYKLWHPRDHVFSDWEGPRKNDSQYIGGSHLVEEYIGGVLYSLKISFKDPKEFFGPSWKQKFQKAGYGTAICGRVGEWNRSTGEVKYGGHLLHLIKNEPDGCRMRSRIWLGDPEGSPVPIGDKIPKDMVAGLHKHMTEEMAILASHLPALYLERRNAKL